MSDDSIEWLNHLAENPEVFMREYLGVSPWEKQVEVIDSVRDHKITAVRSGHGVGKTTIAAWGALWWLITHPYGAVVTTAPSGRQVNELLWKEIRKAYKNAKHALGGELLPKAPKLTIDDDWLAIGFSTDDGVNFQGWHSPGGTLVIFDEAPGVDPLIWEVVKGVLVSDKDRFLAIGNPVEPTGPFYDLFQGGTANCIHISAYDGPNVKAGKTIIPGLATLDWVNERREEWGEDSPMWLSRVMGTFPDSDDRTLVPMSWMDAAIERWQKYQMDGTWDSSVCQIGLDVARKGANATCASEAYVGLGVKAIHVFPKQDTVQTAMQAKVLRDELGAHQIRVDADGLGAGVYDMLVDMLGEDVVVEMRGGMVSEFDRDRFANRRSEWLWTLRQRLDPDGPAPIALPPNQKLRGQLTGMRWGLTTRGQIKLESKDEMDSRGMKSPDEADCVSYGLAVIADRFIIEDHLLAMTRM